MGVTQWLPAFWGVSPDRAFLHRDSTSYVALHYSQNLSLFSGLKASCATPPPLFLNKSLHQPYPLQQILAEH